MNYFNIMTGIVKRYMSRVGWFKVYQTWIHTQSYMSVLLGTVHMIKLTALKYEPYHNIINCSQTDSTLRPKGNLQVTRVCLRYTKNVHSIVMFTFLCSCAKRFEGYFLGGPIAIFFLEAGNLIWQDGQLLQRMWQWAWHSGHRRLGVNPISKIYKSAVPLWMHEHI